MTKTEIDNLMKKITIEYPNWLSEYSDERLSVFINEWEDRLKHLNIQDVYKKLDYHLQGKYNSQPPKIHFLTMGLDSKEEDKKKEIDYLNRNTTCRHCNQIFSLLEFKKHEDRCASARYIIKVMKEQYNKEISYDGLMELSQFDFDNKYDELIYKLMKMPRADLKINFYYANHNLREFNVYSTMDEYL